jgi:hypothetical protein
LNYNQDPQIEIVQNSLMEMWFLQACPKIPGNFLTGLSINEQENESENTTPKELKKILPAIHKSAKDSLSYIGIFHNWLCG